jgi:pimeloyl-[acyl-carrier protein] synthase
MSTNPPQLTPATNYDLDVEVPDEFRLAPFVTIPRSDPYPAYHRLRRRGPVFICDNGLALVHGYDAAVFVLKDPRFGRFNAFERYTKQTGHAEFGETALFANPPTHGRLRSFMSRVFAPKQIERLRDGVQRRIDGLLDRAEAAGGMELIAELALPLPVGVIADLIGLPEEDYPRCVVWAQALVPAIEAVFGKRAYERAYAAATEFRDYLKAQIAIRQRRPSGDLLSTLVQARNQGGELSEEELIANMIMLFVAGHETTVNLIGNAVVLLSKHPDQRARLEADPSLYETMIDEVLRFESPIVFAARVAFEDLYIGAEPIRRGQTVWALLSAANRDPARFQDPDQFDVARSPNPHLAFGSGIHVCLGAVLARLEGRLALESLLRRFPNARVTEATPLAFRKSITIRGYQRVPVAW